MSWVEFLSARLDEDEANFAALPFDSMSASGVDLTAADIAGIYRGETITLPGVVKARLLAEVAAKRAIVEDEHFDGRSGDYIAPWCSTCSDDEDLVYLPCPTLRRLAAVYADHPDYDPAWRL